MPTKGVNEARVMGNLGADPDVRYTPSGTAVCNMRIATSEFWRDAEGNDQERTEWHRIVLFKRQAEVAGEYLSKGQKVYVAGKMQTRKWQDDNGIDRYTTEIVANDLQLIDTRGGSNQGGGRERDQERQYGGGRDPYYHGGRGAPTPQGGDTSDPDDFDDDIPF